MLYRFVDCCFLNAQWQISHACLGREQVINIQKKVRTDNHDKRG